MTEQIINLSDEEQTIFNKLETDISQEKVSIKNISEDEKAKKNTDAKFMIKHYIDMSDRIEDRRARIRTFTLQTLAIWVAAEIVLLSLLFNKSIELNRFFFMVATFIIGTQILFCIYSSIIYEKQSGFRYPFLWEQLKKYGNTWKWFYYSSSNILQMTRDTLMPSNDFNKTLKPFLESYKEYLNQYRRESLDDELVDNIQQLHLLRVHNYYKNRFFLQLTDIQKWSLYSIPISGIIGVLVGWIIS
jgi:hypothetical protein